MTDSACTNTSATFVTSAVVFAYHNVGVRCLKVLLAEGVDVKLVITHQDSPSENIWFSSVEQVARDYDIPVITPENANSPEVIAQISALAPDFLFSFYYRNMLGAPLLELPKRGAFNMHGSLLPKYRGRVPINWAIIHGETETGASLHVMNVKPDNGALVDQESVPILPDDTAHEVFDKVLVAAEICLLRALPKLIAGTAQLTAQDLSQGAYFGGRKAEDGEIKLDASAREIHNLVRAVTRPYPGAFIDTPHGKLVIWRTRLIRDDAEKTRAQKAFLFIDNGKILLSSAGGGLLSILEASLDEVKFASAMILHLPNARFLLH